MMQSSTGPRRATFLFILSIFVLANAALAHGPLHEQIEEVTKLIARYPDSAELYLKRGELHRHHRDWPAALVDYDQSERLEPNLCLVDLYRGSLLLDAGRLEEARKALDRFLAKRPDDGNGLLTRARALAQLGEHLPAATDFSRAIARLDTPQPEYYLERAQAQCAAQQTADALCGLDEGMHRLGQIVTLQLFAVDLEIQQKRYDAALSRLEQIAAQSPRKEKWLARRGEILQMAGRHDEARLTVEAALRVIESLPASRRATKAIVELEKRLRELL